MSTWGNRGVPRHVQQRILKRDKHQCQLRLPGCTTIATEVDDIVPVSILKVTRAQVTDDNRQAVCHECHKVKTENERSAAWAINNAKRQRRRRLPVESHPGEVA